VPRRRLAPLLILAALAALLLFLPAGTRLLVDWWWFREIGYQIVFVREVVARLALFLAAGGLSAGILYLNLRVAQRGLVPEPMVLRLGESVPRVDVTAGLRRLSFPIALIAGALAGLAATRAADPLLQFVYRTPFGVTDPVFSHDVGFYVFTLPVLSAVTGFLHSLGLISLIAVTPIYWLRGDLVARSRWLRIEPTAGLHIAILLAALFLLTALRLWLVSAPQLLFSSTGPLFGASFTDIHARLPALRVTAVAAVLAAGTVIVGALRGNLPGYALRVVVGYLALVLVGRGLIPVATQKLVVGPTELTRETPYLQHHLLATRTAWGLDSVETRDLSGEAGLTLADIRANAPTIENVRLWDREPLLQTFGQLQEIRTYYDFVSVDDDRYWIDGKYRQVLLSPRELNPASLPTRTFINEHLTFTHGMGLTLGPVNQVTVEGLPVLFVRDLPPVSTVSLQVTRPQIYYGELTQPFVITGTRQPEFDHPSGETNVYAAYEGTGGVRVGGLFRRLMFAVRFGSLKILLSQDITAESRILYHRSIVERTRKALPFVHFDRDPYMVVTNEGALQWIFDGYTTTGLYPYAQPVGGGPNYMRNSVKLVLDAYHGSLSAYVSAPNDPLIRTWQRVFPGIFRPLDSMPPDLRSHLRYPDQLYRVQAALYATYHMDAPTDFYHREDQWQIPVVAESNGAVPFMRHIVMRLPEEKQAEFIYMVPFTPRGKDNLAAWMVARNDGEAYGRLRLYRLPRQSLVFGPRQIESRINQDTEIARQVSLWDQRGSRVIRGDLLVIPIEESLLYVQPLYLQAEGGRIPELKRVVLAYQSQVVMRETLEQALVDMFGGVPGAGGRPTTLVAGRPEGDGIRAAAGPGAGAAGDAAFQALVTEARRHYQAALDAQRGGDWARYGEEIGRLGQVLERLEGAATER
jgi:hypothetical protein